MSAGGQDDGRGRLPAPMVQVPGGAAADGATMQQLESAHWIQVSCQLGSNKEDLSFDIPFQYWVQQTCWPGQRWTGGHDTLHDAMHLLGVPSIYYLLATRIQHPLQIHLLGQRWPYGDISFNGGHWSDSSSLIRHSNCTGETCKHCLTLFNVLNGEHNIWKSFPQNIHTFKNLLRLNYEQTLIQARNVR